MKYINRVFILIVLIVLSLFAQDNDKKTYELLALEIEMLGSYQKFSDNTKSLISSASEYEKKGDYDYAIVFLEEALSEIKTPLPKSEKKIDSGDQNFFLNLISGIDYNRQEFELGFEQSDSVLLDELSKPYLGFELKYASDDNAFNIGNTFRYDKENLQNELYFLNKFVNKSNIIELRYGSMVDRNYEYDALGYFETFSELNMQSAYENSSWYWSVKNSTRYKRYKKPSESIPDFFRNTFTAYLVKNYGFNRNIQLDYTFDYNESLKYLNNDFFEHNGGISYQDFLSKKLKFKMESLYRYHNFNYQVSDSIFSNTSGTLSFDPEINYQYNSYINLAVEYNLELKKFDIKTEQEPDYTYHFINPSCILKLGDLASLNFGYVYEMKRHKLQKGLIEQYIEDQDYNSNGITCGFDYSSFKGMYISFSAEYTRRRYPNSVNDADFSLYSNRNILNLLLFAQIPLNKNVNLNAIASYDNDKDIDSDFNDTNSSFYTLEFSYSF